ARFPRTWLAESLRREWLKALGAAASWDVFRAEYPLLASDDVEVTCYSFQERLARDDAEVAAEARALFLAGREAPAACDAVFTALAANGRIGEEDTLQRLRKVFAAGLLHDAK